MNHSSPLKIVAICLLVALSITVFVSRRASSETVEPQRAPAASNYRLSGPYTHRNLTIYLVHGKEQMPGKRFLTLQEALAQKKVRVYETKDVNELAIRNFSNQDIYVQAGDIVRGGDQDRMISIDFIVPPKSGRMPIAAFCVESGRWNKRGKEENASFGSSENSAPNGLKLAAQSQKSQQAVWDNVKVVQASLSENVQRVQMHPADQFEAFSALVAEGRPIEDIAADFGVTPLSIACTNASALPRLKSPSELPNS